MSGLEVVGVVLGAFPFLISAMEHYEETKSASKLWYRIKKSHRKDLGNLKHCELMFKIHLDELLLPLLLDGVTGQVNYEELLTNPGGPGWRQENIEDALAERLFGNHSSYLDLLNEVVEVMAKLSKATKVEDDRFQAGLKLQSEVKNVSRHPHSSRD